MDAQRVPPAATPAPASDPLRPVFAHEPFSPESTSAMVTRLVHHVVGDYETFVVLELATLAQAREHAEGLELHEAIKWATGNVSMPHFEVLETLIETDA